MKMSSICFNCFKIDEMKSFYSLLGVEFEKYQVTLGSAGYRAMLGGTEFNLLPVAVGTFAPLMGDKQKLTIPAYQMTLIVPGIRVMLGNIRAQFPLSVLSDIISGAEGTFVLLEDPQGNKVQLVEAQ